MKRAIAGLLAGLLVLSLAACHEREVQTQQTPETMQEEAPAPEAKPEEKMPAAPETEPGQEASAVGLSEIFSSEMGVASAAELDEEARAYFFDFAARWRLDLLPVATDGMWPEKAEAYLEWLEVTTPWEERTGHMPVREAMERVMAEFYGVPTLSNDGAWEIKDGAYVSPFMDESEYQVRLPELISWQTGALGTYYTLKLAPGNWDEGYRELRERYVQDAEILEESAGRVYVSFLLNDDGAPVFTNKVCAEAGEAPDYVIVPEFEPGLSRLGQDAAWFRAREAAQEWPGLTWNGTSIYDLLLDELKTVYGEPERISHEPFLQEEYYDVVEFPDGSQAGGICFVDTSVTKPNAAYLRLYDGTDACGVTAGEDYREAATLDGCSDMGFLFHIAVPLSIPTISSLAVYLFVQIYNQYFWRMLVTNEDSMRTIQLGISYLVDADVVNYGHILAGAVIAIIPSTLIYIFGQDYIIKGMTAGGLKG